MSMTTLDNDRWLRACLYGVRLHLEGQEMDYEAAPYFHYSRPANELLRDAWVDAHDAMSGILSDSGF
jgi:hypothetical protein